MRRPLEFPVDYPDSGNGSIARTFVPQAIPPRYDLAPAVMAWLFHREELVLQRRPDGRCELPNGERGAGETFRETLDRIACEQLGAHVREARLIGAVEIVDEQEGCPAPLNQRLQYIPCFIAETNLDGERADEHVLIEPALARAHVAGWSELMEAMLSYALAVRSPSQVEAVASRTAA